MDDKMQEFHIDGNQIVISDGLSEYNAFRKKYKDKALEASIEFDKRFSVMFDDMDELNENCPKIAQGYLEKIVDVALRDVIQAGINDVSDDIFIEKYVTPRITWQQDYSEIEDQYLEIVLDSEMYDEYKKSRDNRGGPGVMGGGFGVEGAAAGIAIATAANLAISAVGGILNSASDGLRSLGEKTKKAELFNNPKTRKHLVNSIFNLVFSVHMAVIDLIVEKKGKSKFETVSSESEAKAKAIVENIRKDRIPEEHLKKSLVDAIKLNPYCEEIYTLWFERYGNGDKDFNDLAKFFDIIVPEKSVDPISSVEDPKNIEGVNTDIKEIESTKDKKTEEDETNEELVFDGKTYDSEEEATKLRIEYVEKFLKSGKEIDKGKKDELKKIFKGDEKVNKSETIVGITTFACILIMIFHSPWWHGLVALVAFMAVYMPYESHIKKKSLKNWLAQNKS